MRLTIIFTIFLLLIILVTKPVYNLIQGPFEAETAVGQLKDSIVSYSIARRIAQGNIVVETINRICISIIVFLWAIQLFFYIKQTINQLKEEKK